MSDHALSQTVNSNHNGWRKTVARDAPNGTYILHSCHRSYPSVWWAHWQESESLLGRSAKHKIIISCTVFRGVTLWSHSYKWAWHLSFWGYSRPKRCLPQLLQQCCLPWEQTTFVAMQTSFKFVFLTACIHSDRNMKTCSWPSGIRFAIFVSTQHFSYFCC
jgi:hypothetical protein